jgi:CDP-diglyceride synthetase
MKKYAFSGFRELIFNKNIDYFNKALQLILIPRAFMIMILSLGILTSILFEQHLLINIWLTMFFSYMMVFIIAFPSQFISKRLFKTMLYIPLTMFKMILSIPQLTNANKKFIHTPHTT